MTTTILVAGTASHVGKSTVAAGLCRLLADRGVSVAPFKAQNMSNNASVVLRSPAVRDESDAETGSSETDDRWGEIGVSQAVQARAARTTPTTDVNPVLLKPHGDGESQLVVHGRAVGRFSAGSYYEEHWDGAVAAAREGHRRLARRADVVVAEGAGSIAEINLHHRDLANVETARFADAAIVVLVDIERGGALASLYGTLELLPDDLRERVVGAIVTKFRGDASLLDPGIETLERRTGVPILGVIPHDDPGLPAEDSLSLPPEGEAAVRGDVDGIPDEHSVTIAVPRLPRASNTTDVEPLASVPGVRVLFVPLDGSLKDADAVVIPGTKNTVDDCLSIQRAGFDEALRSFDGPVVGICGGYQLLGERLEDCAVEGTGAVDSLEGVGLLPVVSRFEPEKIVRQVTRPIHGVGPIAGASGRASGYEIHTGRTERVEPCASPIGEDSAATDRVLGTYLHGLFENDAIRDAFVDVVFEAAGRERPVGSDSTGSPYDRAARLVADHVRLEPLGLP